MNAGILVRRADGTTEELALPITHRSLPRLVELIDGGGRIVMSWGRDAKVAA